MRKTIGAALLLASCALGARAGEGAVYRYVDENGVVHYTDRPPDQNAQPAQLPPLRTYTPGDLGELPDVDGEASAAETQAAYRELRIVTPEHEETIRGAQRLVPVAVTSEPILMPGHRVQFYLDGKPRGEPSLATSEILRGVERGTHTVSAAIVDAQGQPLIRSQTVTIFVKPPIAR